MFKPRLILKDILKTAKTNTNLLFLGSRRVGKTVLMNMVKDYLKANNLYSEKQMVFFDLEIGNDLNQFTDKTPEQFVNNLYVRTGLPLNTPLCVFIDEIQYIPNPSSFLKVLADHYNYIKLILSGSSSLEIKKIFTDRLTGRKISFHIPTLTFTEFLDFQESSLRDAWQSFTPYDALNGATETLSKYKDFIPQAITVYEDFVLYGSYPQPSLKESVPIRIQLIEEIRDQYAKRDINDILHIENVPGFNRLLGLLAVQIGNLVNMEALSSAANINRSTVEKYIFLLQETFILRLIAPCFTNKAKEIVKMPKIYFYDTGLRNALIGQLIASPLNLRADKGALVENAVWHELNAHGFETKFWRTKSQKEIDFIISHPQFGNVPLEVKYQNFNRPVIPSGLVSFIEKYKPHHALVVTRDYLSRTAYNSTPVFFVPAPFL